MSVKEMVVLKLDDTELNLERMFSLLKFSGVFPPLAESLITGLLIRKEALTLGLSVSDEELQEAVDNLRYSLNLEKASDTYRWLERNNLTVENLEDHCECSVRSKKLRSYLSEGKVDEYFANNILDFEIAYIAQIIVEDESVAREISLQLQSEEAQFELMAKNYSIDPSARWGGFVGPVKRANLKPDFEAAIFSAQEGSVLSPLKSDRGFHIIKVLALPKPELDEETREQIKDKILSEWVFQAKKKASIEFRI